MINLNDYFEEVENNLNQKLISINKNLLKIEKEKEKHKIFNNDIKYISKFLNSILNEFLNSSIGAIEFKVYEDIYYCIGIYIEFIYKDIEIYRTEPVEEILRCKFINATDVSSAVFVSLIDGKYLIEIKY